MDHPSQSKKSTIPQSTTGCLVGRRIGRGTEKAALFVVTIFREYTALGGGVRHGHLATRRPISMVPLACTPQSYHNQPLLGWVWAESARRLRSGSVFKRVNRQFLLGGKMVGSPSFCNHAFEWTVGHFKNWYHMFDLNWPPLNWGSFVLSFYPCD